MRFEDLGVDTLQATDAYRQIQFFTRARREGLFSDYTRLHSTYSKFKKLYFEEPSDLGSAHYGTRRQQGTSALLSALGPTNSLLDNEKVVSLLRYGSVDCARVESSQNLDYASWGRIMPNTPLTGDYELQRSKGLAAVEGYALEAPTYEQSLRSLRGLHGVLPRKELVASGVQQFAASAPYDQDELPSPCKPKAFASRPRLYTLPSLYDGRGIGDARLLIGHDFFNYLNESELAGCEGAINDGRELSAYQPLSYGIGRSEKSNLTTPLAYTQIAENFREKFAPSEW